MVAVGILLANILPLLTSISMKNYGLWCMNYPCTKASCQPRFIDSNPWIGTERKRRYVTRCHGSRKFWISSNRGPARYDRNKETKKLTCMTFPYIIALSKNGRPYFSSIVRRVCKARSVRFKNFATMATWRHTYSLHAEKVHLPRRIPLFGLNVYFLHESHQLTSFSLRLLASISC